MATTRFGMGLLGALLAAGCGEPTTGVAASGGASNAVAAGGVAGAGGAGIAVGKGGSSSKPPGDGGTSAFGGAVSSTSAGAGAVGHGAGGHSAGGRETGTVSSGGGAAESGGPNDASGMGGQGGVAPMPLPDGLVVHEWGTNTVVSASDGTLELGLQHEEEDLPAFVYDRLRTASAYPNTQAVTTKMETPILYFYSKDALDVSVRVDFPSGILTQWYPAVVDFRPQILWEQPLSTTVSAKDPAMDPKVLMPTLECEQRYRKNGWLDWGRFRVLGRAEAPPTPPSAPKTEYTWSYARDVAANYVSFPGGESERFLFYRGLSNATPPVTVRALAANEQGQRLRLRETSRATASNVFVVRVEDGRAAFNEIESGVPAGEELDVQVPGEAALAPLASYSDALGRAMTSALDAQGLYHDESVAMVNTWKRQWFETPGIRVLYLAPRAWTEATIPLQLSPKPTELVRVMVMRVEVLTSEVEASDRAALMGADETAIRTYFSKLGRFAEPRLRRALAQAPSAVGQAFLEQIAVSVSRNGPTE